MIRSLRFVLCSLFSWGGLGLYHSWTSDALGADVDSNAWMVDELSRLAEQAAASPQDNVYLSGEWVTWFRERLREAKTPVENLYLESQLAMSLLNAGENEKAIQLLDGYQRSLRKIAPDKFSQMVPKIGLLIGVAFLRIGEMENCQDNHTIESCLFPPGGSGVHQLPRGSKAAKGVF